MLETSAAKETTCGEVDSDPQPLLTLELESQPSIETLGLSLADGKAALAQLQDQIVKRQIESQQIR